MRTRQLLGMLVIAQLFCVPAARAVDRTLEIYVENAADPFSRPDGTGYANDVVRAAFEAVGVREHVVGSVVRGADQVRRHAVDQSHAGLL